MISGRPRPGLKFSCSALLVAVACCVSIARAALISAGYNVRININSLEDKSAGDKMLKELAALEKEAAKLEKEIRAVLKERGGI